MLKEVTQLLAELYTDLVHFSFLRFTVRMYVQIVQYARTVACLLAPIVMQMLNVFQPLIFQIHSHQPTHANAKMDTLAMVLHVPLSNVNIRIALRFMDLMIVLGITYVNVHPRSQTILKLTVQMASVLAHLVAQFTTTTLSLFACLLVVVSPMLNDTCAIVKTTRKSNVPAMVITILLSSRVAFVIMDLMEAGSTLVPVLLERESFGLTHMMVMFV